MGGSFRLEWVAGLPWNQWQLWRGIRNGFPWESNYLYYTVREPFPSNASRASVVFGQVGAGDSLKIVSQMPDYGVIFSDGIEKDRLEFSAGMEATIELAERAGQLVQ